MSEHPFGFSAADDDMSLLPSSPDPLDQLLLSDVRAWQAEAPPFERFAARMETVLVSASGDLPASAHQAQSGGSTLEPQEIPDAKNILESGSRVAAYDPAGGDVVAHGPNERRPRRGWLAVAALAAVVLLLVGLLEFLGPLRLRPTPAATPTPLPTALPTSAPTSAPTTIPTPQLTATVSPTPSAGCGQSGGALLTIQSSGAFSSDLYTRLPDNFALKPQLYSNSSYATANLAVDNSVGLDVTFNGGSANQPGEVCAVTVTIESFTPLPNPVPNIYRSCVDQYYVDPGGPSAVTACPAVRRPAGEGGVTFATSSPGTTVTGAIGVANDNSQGSQPAQIPASDGSSNVHMGITVPAAGTYTFSISFWQDQSGSSLSAPSLTQTFLLKQALHEWGGQPCTQPSMQAQLPPPTSPPTLVICPGPPPS